MSFQKYAEYKESGVEWLGEVPKHWEVSLLKRRYQVTLGKMLKSNQTSPNETEEFYLRAANIHWRGVDTTDVKRMWFTPEEKNKLKLCKGDLLVSEGGDVGRSALWNDEIEGCYIQNSINRIRAREDADTRFLFYWMSFIKHADYIDMICNKATIAHFTVEKVEATPCVYPSLEEQKQIAAFLDKETTKIDTLIDKQEQLITLLQEKRQAIISHVVTRGLNPNVKMKDSGIEWLEKVPEHWGIRRLGVYGNFIAGSGFPHKDQGQKSGDYPFYKVSDTNLEGNSVYLVNAENYVTKEVAKKLRAKIAPAGGIMFPKVGAALLGNKRRVLTRESITDNNTIVFVPYSGVSKYWYYWLSELDFGQIANPGPVPSINETQLREFPSICPPEEEQKQIAAFLDKETAKIDTLIEKCETAIELLKERRTALISAAVTGKIDVRNAI